MKNDIYRYLLEKHFGSSKILKNEMVKEKVPLLKFELLDYLLNGWINFIDFILFEFLEFRKITKENINDLFLVKTFTNNDSQILLN